MRFSSILNPTGRRQTCFCRNSWRPATNPGEWASRGGTLAEARGNELPLSAAAPAWSSGPFKNPPRQTPRPPTSTGSSVRSGPGPRERRSRCSAAEVQVKRKSPSGNGHPGGAHATARPRSAQEGTAPRARPVMFIRFRL